MNDVKRAFCLIFELLGKRSILFQNGFIKQSYYASTIILVNNIIQFQTVGNVIYLDSLDTFTELDCYTSLLGGTIILQINLSAATVGYRVKYTASGKVTKSLVALCLRANNQ